MLVTHCYEVQDIAQGERGICYCASNINGDIVMKLGCEEVVEEEVEEEVEEKEEVIEEEEEEEVEEKEEVVEEEE